MHKFSAIKNLGRLIRAQLYIENKATYGFVRKFSSGIRLCASVHSLHKSPKASILRWACHTPRRSVYPARKEAPSAAGGYTSPSMASACPVVRNRFSSLRERAKTFYQLEWGSIRAGSFEAGALDYLLKPVRQERLAQTIERVQRSRHPKSRHD
jgi:hypothetical protein